MPERTHGRPRRAVPRRDSPGVNEASFPLKIGESPLLADDDREVINRGLKQPNRLGPKWRQMQEERLLFALACGQAREFLALTCSWLDLENNRELPPSYLLVDALNRALGGQVEFDWLRELARTCSWIRSVELSDFAPGREELALGPADFELLRLSDSPDSAAAHLLKDESIRRLARLAAERWEGEGVGEFTGFLAGNGFSPGPFSIISQNISVSRLQKFLTCPFLFFLARVLEAEKIEEPERIWDFEKIAQGNVVHEAMDGIFRELKNKKEFQPGKIFPTARKNPGGERCGIPDRGLPGRALADRDGAERPQILPPPLEERSRARAAFQFLVNRDEHPGAAG